MESNADFFYKQALSIEENAWIAGDNATLREQLERAIKCIQEALLLVPKKSDYLYFLGYLYVMLPDKTGLEWDLAIKYLEDCAEIDPQHPFCVWYLATTYFDVQRYADAEEVLSKFDPSYFVKLDQVWRVAVMEETKLCCRLYRGDNISKEDFSKYKEFNIASAAASEKYLIPAPYALARCLVQLTSNKRYQLSDWIFGEFFEYLDMLEKTRWICTKVPGFENLMRERGFR